MLEELMGLAARARPPAPAHRAEGAGPAPRADLLRPSGRRPGVQMLDSLIARGSIDTLGDGLSLTAMGATRLRDLGIDCVAARGIAAAGLPLVPRLERAPTPTWPARWARRRRHEPLHRTEMGRAQSATGSRVVNFTRTGEKRFAALLPNGEG